MGVAYIPPVKKTTATSITCDGTPHALDVGKFTPTRSGLTFAHVYLNVSRYELRTSTKSGRLRVFMRRAATRTEPVDDTYFFDLDLEPGRASRLETRDFFEFAERGRTLRWFAQVDGCSSLRLSTRFVKYAQIY
jgi:hypothetical protein